MKKFDNDLGFLFDAHYRLREMRKEELNQKINPDILESVVESYLRHVIKELGGLCPKMAPFIQNGIPDRLVLLPYGRSAFFELKRLGKKPTPLQEIKHKQLRELGYFVWVADSKLSVLEGLLKFIEHEINK